MRGVIARGLLRGSRLGSPMRMLVENQCPTTGVQSGGWSRKYNWNPNFPFYTSLGGAHPGITPDTKAYQCFGVNGSYGLIATNHFALKPGGKWKIDLTLKIFRAKVPDPVHPARNWLFCNLERFKKNIDGSTASPNFAELIRHNGNDVKIDPWLPSDANPTQNSDPNNINSTWKWDLTLASPSTFTDSLIVPEENLYCFVGFDSVFYDFDSNFYLDTLMNCYGYPAADILNYTGFANSDPLGQFGGPNPNHSQPPVDAGGWDLPLPAFLASGAVDVSPSGISGNTQQMANYLTAHFPGWNTAYPLWEATFTLTRLVLEAMFFWANSINFTIVFTNASITNPLAITYAWNFGDGTTSTSQSPTHTYASNGPFDVSLTISDSSGNVSVQHQSVRIILKADYTFHLDGAIPAQNVFQVTFTNKSVGAVTYDWDFGDGSTHSGAVNPVHKYPRNSTFACKLTAFDNGTGSSNSITKTIVTT